MFDLDFSSIYLNLESLCKLSLDNGYLTDNTVAGSVQQGTFDADGYKRITGDNCVAGDQNTVVNNQT